MAVECCGETNGLPMDCLINTLSLTSPRDACRFSVVDSVFRSVAQYDVVWERFLPSDYLSIVSSSVDGLDLLLAKFKSKKELYFYLCDHPILIDSGLKSFSLEKSTGKKCYMLSARDLILGKGFGQWISHPQSRFSRVAELLDVWWFQIRGKINMKMLSSGTNYAAYLVLTCGPIVHGFGHDTVEACVGIIGHEVKKRNVSLDANDSDRHRYGITPPPGRVIKLPMKRDDGWMEVELGELFVEGGEDGDLEMTLMEVKYDGNWKGGIIIEGIEIRPKEC